MTRLYSTRGGSDRGDLSAVAFGLVFLLVGAGVVYGVYSNYQRIQDVRNSVETAEGTVTTSNVRQFTEPDTEEGGAETEYFPQVKYTYTVDGKTYNGRYIYSKIGRGNTEYGEPVGKEFENRRRARQVIAGYQEGGTARVYYFPDDPARSFLIKPRVNWFETIAGVLFGGVFAVVGLLVALGGLLGSGDGDDSDAVEDAVDDFDGGDAGDFEDEAADDGEEGGDGVEFGTDFE